MVKKFKISSLAALIFLFCFSCSKSGSTAPSEIDEEFSGNLTGLIVGIPQNGTSDFAEIRDAFSVDEKHAVRGFWNTRQNGYQAEFIWFNPENKVAYSKIMQMDPEWKRTFVHYRGDFPLQAGNWTIGVKVDGKFLGKTTFSVVRDRSQIPLLAQIEAFNAEKITLDEAHFLAEKIRCFADKKCDETSIINEIPQTLANKKTGLAVSVFRKSRLSDVVFSSAEKISDAIKELLKKIKRESDSPASIELSVIHSSIQIKASEQLVSAKMKQGMGFSLSSAGKSAAILPTQISRNQLEDGTAVVRQLAVDAGLPENAWKESKLTAFMTQDFILSEKMNRTKESAFSRSVVPIEKTTRKELIDSVDAAFGWYLKNQLTEGAESGRYMYSFFPSKDLEPKDDWALRNLNGVFVLAEIAKDRKNPVMIESVKRAITLFRSALVDGHNGKYLDWKYNRKVSSIAGTAFLLGAMVELNEPDYKDDMKKMADAIIALQEPSGKFKTDFYRPLRDIDQLYYPGETLLILMRYYNLTKYEPALDAVKKGYPFYQNFWNDKKNRRAPFVPWQIRAYQEAYKVTKDKRHAEFVFQLADWMLKKYKPLGNDAALGRRGALNTQFASTGVYSEGLSAALSLAIELKDKERIKRYGFALRGALGYLLGLQFKEEDIYWIKRGDKVLGALAMRPDSNELRLDATYHAISAIHYTTKLLSDDEWQNIVWK